jgi:hypothetical protein
MTLGELKLSLNRMSGDLDDSEVMFVMLDHKNNNQYDLLAFTAYTTIPSREDPVVILGSHQAALKMLGQGKLKYPDGTRPDLGKFPLQ